MTNLPAPSAKSTIGRADLLRVLAADGEQALGQMAFALGYERMPGQAVEGQVAESPPIVTGGFHGVSPSEPVIGHPTPAARFFYVTERIPISPEGGENPFEPPAWYVQAKTLTQDECSEPAKLRLPARLPLTCWSRLWPFLRLALGETGLSSRLDIPRVVRTVARGGVLHRLPWRTRHQWSTKLCILLDYNRQTRPFREDFNALCEALEAMHGAVGLDIRILHNDPGRRCRYRQPSDDTLHYWQMPDASTPLLILSDLGLLDAAAETARAWQLFGRHLQAAGCRPVVLCPVGAYPAGSGLHTLFSLHEWDRHSRLRRGGQPAAHPATVADGAEVLLALAAPAIVIESALLRSLRYLLPSGLATAAAEAHVWSHVDIVAGSEACRFADSLAIAKYQQEFQQLDPSLQAQAVALILSHHVGLPASVRYAEMDACECLAPGSLDDTQRVEVLHWKRNIVKTVENANCPPAREWQRRHLGRQPFTETLWQDNKELAALWAIEQRRSQNRQEIPDCVRKELNWYFLQETAPQSRLCSLRQRGQQLVLESGDAKGLGSFFAGITVAGGVFVRESLLPEAEEREGTNAPNTVELATEVGRNKSAPTGVSGKLTGQMPETVVSRPYSGLRQNLDSTTSTYVPVANSIENLVELSQCLLQAELETATEMLRIVSLAKPAWALAIGRDRQGLFAEAGWMGQIQRLSWCPPELGQPGAWHCDGPLGVDEFGLYADLQFNAVNQRFRWIVPGKFLMGSPDTEPERWKNETQHEVTLTQGYWLADSACTQALWRAVTGDNPSRFQGNDDNPVEQVSWDDAQAFIAKLNRLVPGLHARLPTEAEWEYACRAGTSTPFSFGGNITPEQVNYNGEYPYADGKKGQYRGKTVPVKSLPPNPWGLYEMHGNVWEWCQDWFVGEYGTEPQVDPQGPSTGAYRVLRGGSWGSDGGDVRSAYRSRNEPGFRNYNIGFRLALGQTGSGQSAAPRPPGQPQAERRGGQGGRSAAEKSSPDEAKRNPGQSEQALGPKSKGLFDRLKSWIKPKK